MMSERYQLSKDRIGEILRDREADCLEAPYNAYFTCTGQWLVTLMDRFEELHDKEKKRKTTEELKRENRALYEEILPEHYGTSFCNPEYAVKQMGLAMGQLLSFLYVELRSQIEAVYQNREEEFQAHLEVWLELFGLFASARAEEGTVPDAETVGEILYWFVYDYMEPVMTERVREQVDSACDFAREIVMNSDLDTPDYLYRYGEYVTENELKTAAFLASLPEEQIALMADTYTEGYRKGFALAGKDLSRKDTVNIRYSLGFERVIRRAIRNFADMGLKPTMYRAATNIWSKRGVHRIGYYGAVPNRQMDYDHREDLGLFLDQKMTARKKEALKNAYEEWKGLAKRHAGPACMEVFGEKQFDPVSKPEAVSMTEKQQQLTVDYTTYSTGLVNEYIPGDERSFTIIAFPVPEIGEQFEAIFEETIRINTLDYQMYADIQETIIHALDEACKVEIVGHHGNRTNMTVMLHPVQDIGKETKFENCVADVNIPVGEVFTSPQLEGTEGILHVTRVFLEGLEYRQLAITFRDGMITDYNCENFASGEENRKYIRDNILFHHPTLPLGEFAIGTNTTAYVAAQRYDMFAALPILIAEKMGPHFAVGDTCYSHAEDVKVYNPDGREIIARDNSVSIKRLTEPDKAYFGCHTDITIPYDELKSLVAIREDGSRISIIENGRFVLPGCERLNDAFDTL